MIDRLIDIPSGNTPSEDPAIVICLLYIQKAHYLIFAAKLAFNFSYN
jgi:hypothetical protein